MKAPYDLYENGFEYIRLENLKLGNLPKKLKVADDELVLKPEFHISLVWVGRLSEMVDAQNKEKIQDEMIKAFDQFTEEYLLRNYEFTEELRLVKKGNQKTIIAMAEVPNLDIFFEGLRQKYEVEFPLQPTHITLYTLPTDKIGIGILSHNELEKYSEPIDIPGIKKLLY